MGKLHISPEMTVTVVMDRNDYFPWQNGPSFEARILSGPQGAGDTYKLSIPGSDRVLLLNGNGSGLIGMYVSRPELLPEPGEGLLT
jgi:hypothetical protein